MKKFVLFSVGFQQPTPEIMQAWGKWFASIGDRMVDGGSPLGPGREITRSGTRDLPLDLQAVSGYMIISAENMAEAEKIAADCPIITSIRIHEAMSH